MLKRLHFVMVLTLLLFALNIFVGTVQSQVVDLRSFTEPGPYDAYHTEMTFVDENREDWELRTLIWYPAHTAQGTPVLQGSSLLENVPPDRSGAPYPLIIYSHGGGGRRNDMEQLISHLASYGYVVAAPQHHDHRPDYPYVDRPLDILKVIDSFANITDGDLAGMIDTDNVGLMGFSSGAEVSLQMIGLMHDPIHYESWCEAHPDLTTSDCGVDFQYVSAYRAQLGLEDLPDRRWQPFGDDRIRAILPISPCMFPLTTDEMLAEVSTPVMIVHGIGDDVCDYGANSVNTYTGLTVEDRYLITLVYSGHVPSQIVVQPFATTFFGLYLQGDEDFAAYLTATQAEKIRGVVWGPYESE